MMKRSSWISTVCVTMTTLLISCGPAGVSLESPDFGGGPDSGKGDQQNNARPSNNLNPGNVDPNNSLMPPMDMGMNQEDMASTQDMSMPEDMAPPEPIVKTMCTVSAGAGLRLRSCAGTDGCDILTVMPDGAEVEQLDEDSGWVQLDYQGQLGWASAMYLSCREVTITPCVGEACEDLQPVLDRLGQQLCSGVRACGIAVRNLSTGLQAAYQGDERVNALSSIKLAMVAAAIEAGATPDEPLSACSGLIDHHKSNRDIESFSDHAYYTLQWSNNNTTACVLSHLANKQGETGPDGAGYWRAGVDGTNDFLERIGVKTQPAPNATNINCRWIYLSGHSHLGTGCTGNNGNYYSAWGAVDMLEYIWEDMQEPGRSQLLDYFKSAYHGTQNCAPADPETPCPIAFARGARHVQNVWHKTGAYESWWNDIGLFEMESGDIIAVAHLAEEGATVSWADQVTSACVLTNFFHDPQSDPFQGC